LLLPTTVCVEAVLGIAAMLVVVEDVGGVEAELVEETLLARDEVEVAIIDDVDAAAALLVVTLRIPSSLEAMTTMVPAMPSHTTAIRATVAFVTTLATVDGRGRLSYINPARVAGLGV